MAGITLAQAEARLTEYMSAESKVLSGQEYQIGERRLKRADLAEIRAGINHWQGMVDRLARGSRGFRVRGATPT